MRTTQKTVWVGVKTLTIQDIAGLTFSESISVEVDPGVEARLKELHSYVAAKVRQGTKSSGPLPRKAGRGGAGADTEMMKRIAIYGVTTGFGALKGKFLPDADAAKRLQKNIILSHSAGVGPHFSDDVVRATMVIRAHTLARGYSGARFELIERLVAMLNCDVLPVIPEQGSVGCSGDLGPLAHLALGLIGEGKVRFKEKEYPNLAGLRKQWPDDDRLAALSPTFRLAYKEGLALINGISVTTALAALNVHKASRLLLWADAIGSMTAEAILGAPRAFDEIVFKLIYGHQGAAVSASNVRAMVLGSELMNSSPDVHDPYSVRCIPQVHGAVRDVLKFVESAVTSHLKTVDDDPAFFTKQEVRDHPPADGWFDRLHFEDGHFHGAPVGYAMDFLAIAVADLGSIAERRVAMLVDSNHNRGGKEVPGFLTYNPDSTTSGMMIAQYTAASLVSENKVLAHPASVDSIPTSANHEDHVSMSTIAARKAKAIIANVEGVLAIELLCASLALAFRAGDLKAQSKPRKRRRMGDGTRQVYDVVKKAMGDFQSFDGKDCILYEQIDKIKELLKADPPAPVRTQTS